MKKFFLIFGVASALIIGAHSAAQAGVNTTFLGYSGCTCTDTDNGVDIMSASSVTLACPGVASPTVFYDALGTGTNTVKEFSCGGIVGGTTVINDPVSNKPMVASITRTCPKGYVAKTVSKQVVSPLPLKHWHDNFKKAIKQ